MIIDTTKKITFFFGAGAEGKSNFDLPTGFEYLKRTILGDHSKEYLKALKKYFNKMNYFENYRYTSRTTQITIVFLRNFILSKLQSDPNFLKKHQYDLERILTEDNLDELEENLEINANIKDINFKIKKNDETDAKIIKEVLNEFKEIITGGKVVFKDITAPLLKDLFERNNHGEITFDLNVGAAGYLDGYFHTIINPTKYGVNKFSIIFNYYWACYFTIIEGILKHCKNQNCVNELLEYLNDDDTLNYLKILENIRDFTKQLYANYVNMGKPDTYYQLISEELKNKSYLVECKGAITTNYYPFAKTVSDNLVFLNGCLKLFEFPEILEVRDLETESIPQDHLFFPFIFGQSLVKPVVHPKQMEEFKQFSTIINDSDILVIFGFNINEDDNHINAFLHNYVQTNKKLIVVGSSDAKTVSKRLKCLDSQVEYCKVDYSDNKKVIEDMFKKINSLS